jgi:hypothetical protein
MLMASPLYPTFQKRVADACDALILKQVDPWIFMTSSGLRVTNFSGDQIAYSGIGFEGSPQIVFWSRYIEPFMEDIAVKEFDAARSLSAERKVDAASVLREVHGLLTSHFERIFLRMADVDRRLRGKGFPERIGLRGINREVGQIRVFLDEHLAAELKMAPSRSRLQRFETWVTQHKGILSLGGLLTAIVGALTKCAHV